MADSAIQKVKAAHTAARNKQRTAAPKLAGYVEALKARAAAGPLSPKDAAQLKVYSERLKAYDKNIAYGNESVAKAKVAAIAAKKSAAMAKAKGGGKDGKLAKGDMLGKGKASPWMAKLAKMDAFKRDKSGKFTFGKRG